MTQTGWLDVLKELVGQTPLVGLVAALVWALHHFREAIATRLKGLKKIKAGPVDLEFGVIEEKLLEATDSAHLKGVVESTITNKSYHVEIGEREKRRVLDRARDRAKVLQRRRVLWVDDQPKNNVLERQLLESAGLEVKAVETNAEAIDLLCRPSGIDLVVSDIGRPAGQPNGLDLAAELHSRSFRKPLIFYVTVLDETKSIPLGDFGITNRPDELLHLVIDVLERRA